MKFPMLVVIILEIVMILIWRNSWGIVHAGTLGCDDMYMQIMIDTGKELGACPMNTCGSIKSCAALSDSCEINALNKRYERVIELRKVCGFSKYERSKK